MKKLSIALLVSCFFLFHQTGISQKKKVKFGKLDIADLERIKSEDYPDAEAVILYDSGQSRIAMQEHNDSRFVITFERHLRIKILKESGKSWGDFSVAVYQAPGMREEKFTGLKAITYNLDNKKIIEDKLSANQVFDEQRTSNWGFKKFAMPNVKAGSIIEIKYAIESEYLYTFREWNFEHRIPCLYSEYKTEIPEYFKYKKSMKGYRLDRLTVNESTVEPGSFNMIVKMQDRGRATNRSEIRTVPIDLEIQYDHWVTENMPALEDEIYMLNTDDYLTGVEFELSSVQFPQEVPKFYGTNWQQIQSDLKQASQFGGQLARKGWVKEQVQNIETTASTPEEKIRAAYELVQSKMKWSGRNSIWASSTLEKAFKQGLGSSADINLTLVLLLRELGLTSAPVLVSTRNNGQVSVLHPSLTQFNYVIAGFRLGEEYLLLDATDAQLPFGLLPVRCLNDKGRWIGEDLNEWISLDPAKGYSTVTQLNMALQADGNLTGEINQSVRDYATADIRSVYAVMDDESSFWDNWVKKYPGLSIEESSIEKITDLSREVRLKLSVNLEGQVEAAGELFYFNPLLVFGLKENPFKQEERLYPVSFPYPIKEKTIVKFMIPEGYTVEEAPEEIAMRLPEDAAKFVYSVKVVGEFVLVTSNLSINKLQHLPNDYGALKTFYDKVLEKQREPLVLKKQ